MTPPEPDPPVIGMSVSDALDVADDEAAVPGDQQRALLLLALVVRRAQLGMDWEIEA